MYTVTHVYLILTDDINFVSQCCSNKIWEKWYHDAASFKLFKKINGSEDNWLYM